MKLIILNVFDRELRMDVVQVTILNDDGTSEQLGQARIQDSMATSKLIFSGQQKIKNIQALASVTTV